MQPIPQPGKIECGLCHLLKEPKEISVLVVRDGRGRKGVDACKSCQESSIKIIRVSGVPLKTRHHGTI